MSIKNFIFQNSDKLLMAGGILGIFGTAISASIATSKAGHDIRVENHEMVTNCSKWLTPLEKVRLGWKYYIPSAIFAAGGVSCILWLNHIHIEKQVALSSALLMSYKYRDKVKELYDDDKVIRSIQKDIAVENFTKGEEGMPEPDLKKGEYLYYEPISKQFFVADENRILEAELVVNKTLSRNWEVRFDEYLEYLGLKPSEEDYTIGWFATDNDGYWDWNWSFTDSGMSPWVSIKTETFTDEYGRKVECLTYNINPDYNPDDDMASQIWPKHKS